MKLNIKEILTVTMILFAVIDIIGSIPVVIEVRRRVGHIHSEKATIVSFLIMMIFLFVGNSILEIIGIDIGSFAIAGSFILFFIALEMVTGIKIYKDSQAKTASVVPIAFPLIAGAGTMTTLLSLKAAYSMESIVIAICINVALVYIVLKNTMNIENFLGPGGIDIVRKVFGVILLAIAVKLFRSSIGIDFNM
ncbi:MAG: MarC family protein [Bacteroidia bacterium]|nr:MarC family protein [Bacteroidia bacterium]MCZ2247969.1 MarC family protein [Bacteroidia bacterium]